MNGSVNVKLNFGHPILKSSNEFIQLSSLKMHEQTMKMEQVFAIEENILIHD